VHKHCSLAIFAQIPALSKKLKIFFNYVLGPVLFVWVSVSLYREIRDQEDLHKAWELIKDSLQGSNLLKLLVVVLLMLVNWGIEARKWQVLVRSIERIPFLKAFKAVFSGQSLAVNTPNRVGEYVGRVLYLDEGHRLKGVALTLVGSFSQTIVTLLAGATGLFLMRSDITDALRHILTEVGFLKTFPNASETIFDIFFYGVAVTGAVLLVVYYELSWLTKLLERLPVVNRYSYIIEKLEDMHWAELTRILSLSVTRYVVFVVQFLLLLQLFQVAIPLWQGVWLVSVFFVVLAVVPTISSIELSLRGLASVALFGILSTNKLGIIATTAGLWFINLIVPALVGSIFILGVKIYKR